MRGILFCAGFALAGCSAIDQAAEYLSKLANISLTPAVVEPDMFSLTP